MPGRSLYVPIGAVYAVFLGLTSIPAIGGSRARANLDERRDMTRDNIDGVWLRYGNVSIPVTWGWLEKHACIGRLCSFMVRWNKGACFFPFNHSSSVVMQYSPYSINDASRVSADDAVIPFSQRNDCQSGGLYCIEVTRESQALTSSRIRGEGEEGKNFNRSLGYGHCQFCSLDVTYKEQSIYLVQASSP